MANAAFANQTCEAPYRSALPAYTYKLDKYLTSMDVKVLPLMANIYMYQAVKRSPNTTWMEN